MTVIHRIELVDLLKELNILGPAAEIGVAEGNFSRDLLVAGIPHLYMVDNWKTIKGQKGDGGFPQHWHDRNFQLTKEKIKPYYDYVTILRGLSVDMAEKVPDESLSLVYIDCDHSYDGVMRDLKAWFPKVRFGGVIAGHDYYNTAYGVYTAVKHFTDQYGLTPIMIPENGPTDASFYFIKNV